MEIIKARDEGKLGKIEAMKFTTRDPFPPPEKFFATSGGIVFNIGVHSFDFAQYFT
jgi:myo-inositol 2-dehydrogenase/D-chiro-inositol 1-dehydrogenase